MCPSTELAKKRSPMQPYIIRIEWQGPFSLAEVKKKVDGGNEKNDHDGEDYGLYQICGWHILNGPNTLLYIGQAIDQTFATRFRQHEKEWLVGESWSKRIFLGRINGLQYTKRNKWHTWCRDVDIAEAVMIYKYTPNYNSQRLWGEPNLKQYGFKAVHLKHIFGNNAERIKNRFPLETRDRAPDDYIRRENKNEKC